MRNARSILSLSRPVAVYSRCFCGNSFFFLRLHFWFCSFAVIPNFIFCDCNTKCCLFYSSIKWFEPRRTSLYRLMIFSLNVLRNVLIPFISRHKFALRWLSLKSNIYPRSMERCGGARIDDVYYLLFRSFELWIRGGSMNLANHLIMLSRRMSWKSILASTCFQTSNRYDFILYFLYCFF